jgi:hypothetical protein
MCGNWMFAASKIRERSMPIRWMDRI